jgi:TRAP-type mannitol/chloroaromatic compound transport system substrate-binding protein
MKLSRVLKLATVAGVTAAIAVASGSATAQSRVKWKMQSAFGSQIPHLGPPAVRFSENIKVMSDNKFQVKFFEPNALVPALETFDAVSKGSIESAWTTAGYHVGKYPALAFFTTVPFGPQLGEFMAWKKFGGGDELENEILGKHDLVSLDVNAIGPETSGWFREPVQSLDALKGMKMRFFGLGAKVMTKIGMSTQLLAGADIYPALERGVIDATEFSMPTIDISYGFHQIAKHNYYPGWHQQVSVGHLLMNKPAHAALPDSFKRMLEMAAGWNMLTNYAESEAANPKAMNEMLSKYGVTNHRWTDEQLAVFEKAWNEVVAEEVANDPLFKKVSDSYNAFRAVYKTWGEAQYLAPTYLK